MFGIAGRALGQAIQNTAHLPNLTMQICEGALIMKIQIDDKEGHFSQTFIGSTTRISLF